jgi:hypothetical protein
LLATCYVLDSDSRRACDTIVFFARHGPPHGFRDFDISLPAAAHIVPRLSPGVSRNRDLTRCDVLIESICARAVRQRFSTFSIPRALRRIRIGIIL